MAFILPALIAFFSDLVIIYVILSYQDQNIEEIEQHGQHGKLIMDQPN